MKTSNAPEVILPEHFENKWVILKLGNNCLRFRIIGIDMWKKRLAILGVACMAFLAAGTTSYAGNINAAEQRIIDYYSGVFVYNGKNYVFTESAKATAYNKLASDDVDLTDAEATSAIRQGRSKLKQGIDEGYLVEMGSDGSGEGDNPGNGDNTDPGDGPGNSGDNTGSGNSGNNNPGDNTNPGNSGGNGTGNNGSGNDGTGNNGTGNNGSGNDGLGNNGTGNNGAGNNGSGNNGTGNGNVGNGGTGSDGDGGNSGGYWQMPDNPKKIDIEGLFQELEKDKEHNTIVGLDNQENLQDAQVTGNSFTVEQYMEGKAMAVTKNGEVLLETELPIKNTGFYNGDMKKILIVAGTVFLLVMLGVVWLARSKKNRKAAGYLGIPLIFTFVFALFSGFLLTGIVGNQLDKWNSLWISGAPGYSYAYAQEIQDTSGDTPTDGSVSQEEIPMLLSGEQYGELSCEKAGLQAPLYYGDTDEILEKGAGTYAGSYLPGMGGTILIGAHDATFFAPLEKIGKDDVISLTTSYGKYQYNVTGTQTADLMDASAYQITGDGEKLILYTCYPFGAEGQIRNQRFYVYAEKISGPEMGE